MHRMKYGRGEERRRGKHPCVLDTSYPTGTSLPPAIKVHLCTYLSYKDFTVYVILRETIGKATKVMFLGSCEALLRPEYR